MKKLLIGLFAAASASIAAHAAPISGTSFEGVALKDFGGSADGAIAVNSDDAGVSGNPSYWAYESATDGQKVGWFTNRTDNAEGQWGKFENPGYIWGENKTVGLPDISGGNFANDEKYLKLDANTRINRLISPNGGTSEDMDGVYFDAMVQFTPTYEAPDLDDADKIAVWLYGSDGDDGIKDDNDALIRGTNIVVTAGFIDGAYPSNVKTTNTKHYFTTTEIEPNTWHRVTIKSIKNISTVNSAGGSVPGFVVFIDGVAVATASDDSREDSENVVNRVFENLTTVAQNYNSKNALFPSRAIDTTISLAGFIGTGALDDVSFTKDAPAFDRGPTGFTVSWPAGLASLTVDTDPDDETDGSAPQGFVAGTAGSYTYELAAGSKFGIEAVPSAGNMNVEWKYDDASIGKPNANEMVYTPAKEGTLQIVVAPIVAKIGDTEYASFSEALEASKTAESEATIKLQQNNLDIGAEAFEITNDVTVDLNGNTMVTSGEDPIFKVSDGTLTIISSVAGGTLEASGTGNGVYVAMLNNDTTPENAKLVIGAASGDLGVKIDGEVDTGLVVEDEETTTRFGYVSLVRGSFAAVNFTNGLLDETKADIYAVAEGSKVTGPDEGGFYTVAPEAAALTIQIVDLTSSLPYSGSAQSPTFTVQNGDGEELENGVDYTFAWNGNMIDAGTYQLTVTGIGDYEGLSATGQSEITPLSMDDATVQFESATYTGTVIEPQASVSINSVPVPDVTISCEQTILAAGTYNVTVTPVSSNFSGSKIVEFTVSQKTVIATVQLAKDEEDYKEGLELPTATIGFGGDTLAESTDYTVAWDKNAITEPQDSAEIYTLTVSPVAGSNFTFEPVTATYKVKQTTPDTGKYAGPGGGEFTIPTEATAPAGKSWSDTVTVDGADITYAQAYALNLTISETGEVSGKIKTTIKIENGKVVLDVQGREGYAFEAKFFKSTDLKAWSETATIDSGAEGGDAVGEDGKAFYKVSITTIKINDAKAE